MNEPELEGEMFFGASLNKFAKKHMVVRDTYCKRYEECLTHHAFNDLMFNCGACFIFRKLKKAVKIKRTQPKDLTSSEEKMLEELPMMPKKRMHVICNRRVRKKRSGIYTTTGIPEEE